MAEQVVRLHFHQFWLFIGMCLVSMVIYLSLNTGEPSAVASFLHDKLSHMLGYFGLMLWFLQLYSSRGKRWLVAGLLVMMGVMLEYLQGIGGVRTFEFEDMLANTLGVVIGWLIALMGADRILGWIERRYLVRC